MKLPESHITIGGHADPNCQCNLGQSRCTSIHAIGRILHDAANSCIKRPLKPFTASVKSSIGVLSPRFWPEAKIEQVNLEQEIR